MPMSVVHGGAKGYGIYMPVRHVYALLFVLALVYLTHIVRISNAVIHSPGLTYTLLVYEEYVLFLILAICYSLRDSIVMANFFGASALMLYMFLTSSIRQDPDVYYFKFMFFWFLHYLIYVNVLRRLDRQTVFYILLVNGFIISVFYASVALPSADITVSTTAKTLRGTPEGYGMLINANTLSMMLVGIAVILVVIKHNYEVSRRAVILSFTYHLMVLLVLLINATVSATIFFMMLLLYDLNKTYHISRLMFVFLVVAGIVATIGVNLTDINVFRRMSSGATVDLRTINMIQSLNIFMENPFFGIGHARVVEVEEGLVFSADHNFYTKLLGAEGIFGFLMFLGFLLFVLRSKRSFNGLFLLRIYCLYFLLFAPSNSIMTIAAAFIYDFGRGEAPEGESYAFPDAVSGQNT